MNSVLPVANKCHDTFCTCAVLLYRSADDNKWIWVMLRLTNMIEKMRLHSTHILVSHLHLITPQVD